MLTQGTKLQSVVGVEFGSVEQELVMDEEYKSSLIVMLEEVKG